MSSLPPTLPYATPAPEVSAWQAFSRVLAQIAHRGISISIFLLIVPVGAVLFPDRLTSAVRPVLIVMFILLDLAVVCSLANVLLRARRQLETADSRNTLVVSLVLLLVTALWMIVSA